MADLAGEEYWSHEWRDHALPSPWEPDDTSLDNHAVTEWDGFFSAVLSGAGADDELIEVGCGNSVVLPYLANRFGLRVAGLDYSEPGCRRARQILDREGVEAEVVRADLFSPPAEFLGRFSYAVSMGVVEHFDDPSSAIRAIADLVRPGGTVVTTVPNMCGLNGWIQRLANRAVYDVHVPLDPERLEAASEDAGLETTRARFLCAFNLWVLNFRRTEGRWPRNRDRLVAKLNRTAWWLERQWPKRFRPNRRTSPYVVVTARKP